MRQRPDWYGGYLILRLHIAAESAGQTLLDDIAELVGADVTASNDPTGSSELGGDWDLEYQTAAIEVSTVLDDGVPWEHTLGVVANQAPWTNLAVTTDRSTTISETYTVTATPGSDRLLLATMVTRFGFDQTIDVTSASFGGVQMHEIVEGSSDTTRNGVWMGYLLDSEIPAGEQTLTVSFTSTVSDPTGTKLLAATYVGVDQTTPINDSSANNTKVNAPISFGSQIDYVAGAEVVYVASFGGNTNTNTTEPAGYSKIYTNEWSGLLMTTIGHKDDTATAGYSPDSMAVDFEGTDANHSIVVVALNPAGVNNAPEITSNGGGATVSINVAENTTSVTTVTATDAYLDTLTYSISGGTDSSLFEINASTGELTFKIAPDFENPGDVNLDNTYEVIVQADDGKSGTDTQTINVTVTNINEGPDQNVQINENTILVATMGAGDQDEPPYWIVGGADAALFQVSHNPVSRTFYLMFNAAPNYESPADSNLDNVYEVTVNFDSVIYNYFVTVKDANDARAGLPTISGTLTEDQTLTADTSSISDEDELGTFSYQWLRNGSAISGATSSTYILDDPDVGAQMSVQVSYTDGGGTVETVTSAQTAAITNVNDAPVLGGSGMHLTTITEDTATNNGDLVSAIIASAGGDPITDADVGAVEGIAIFNLSNSNGTWEYDIGSGWMAVGSVSTNSSLLLRATDRLRFVPNADWNGTELFTFAAWDQTSGTAGTKVDTSTFGGTTAFSSGTAIPSITVDGVNDDPTNAGSLPTDRVFLEDMQGKLNLSAIDLSDVDAGSGNLTLTITSDNGHLQTLG